MADIRVGDIGTELVVVIVDETGTAVDVSAATEMKIYLTPPGRNRTPLAFTASLDTTGTDGKIKYVTRGTAYDLSESGDWSIEGFAAVGSGSWEGGPSQFTVGPSARYPGR